MSNRSPSRALPVTTKIDDDDVEPLISPFEQRFYEECVPMMEWQTQSFPNCNALHEASVVDGIVVVSKDDDATTTTTTDEEISLLSLEGSWRSVWKLHQHNTNETIVLKLQRYDRDFTPLSYEHHRVDALAMERLTRSPHIVDIFGYCGMSVLTEYATGSARNFVKNRALRSLDRLEIGRDLAQALADVHGIDYPNSTNVTLVHNDMNMANAVEVNGRLKLNDFNIGVLQRWNTTTTKLNLPRPGPLRGAPLEESRRDSQRQLRGRRGDRRVRSGQPPLSRFDQTPALDAPGTRQIDARPGGGQEIGGRHAQRARQVRSHKHEQDCSQGALLYRPGVLSPRSAATTHGALHGATARPSGGAAASKGKMK